MSDKFINGTGLGAIKDWILTKLGLKQDTLISGTTVKTINSTSLLGSGNIDTAYFFTDSTVTFADLKDAILARKPIIYSPTNSSSPTTGDYREVINTYYASDSIPISFCVIDGEHMYFAQVKPDNTMNTLRFNKIINEVATNNISGTVKLNSSQNIGMDENGRLVVGGRMGQFPSTTGIYAPNNREPRMVADYDLLVTDALGMNMTGNRSLGVVSGYGLTCKSAPAGSTEYHVTNNYNNRILCKLAEGGFASRDEATSKVKQIVEVLSVTINGASYTPDSSANGSDDIIIKTAETLNPDSAITNIRLFGTMGSYATIHTGNGIKSESGGRNLLLGGGVTKASSSNDNCLVGNGIYSSSNGVAAFGRYHILRKNRGFFAGTGHDSTNAPSEGASAVGQYSLMTSSTLFAIGNGTSHTARSNAFEVTSDSGMVLKSPNGTRYKITVDDTGNLTTTAI